MDFEKIMQRCDIKQLRSFILEGKECEDSAHDTNILRLDHPTKTMTSIIEEKFAEDCDPIADAIFGASNAHTYVFLELGLRAGIKIASQILTGR